MTTITTTATTNCKFASHGNGSIAVKAVIISPSMRSLVKILNYFNREKQTNKKGRTVDMVKSKDGVLLTKQDEIQ